MRALAYLGLLVIALLACDSESVPPARSAAAATTTLIVVPDGAGVPAAECNIKEGFFPGTGIEDREEWYGAHLSALGEHPLCLRPGAPDEVYRLTWLPSFHPSVIVRIDNDSARYRLVAKVESGAGGYDPGHLVRDTVLLLSNAERGELTGLLSASRFWREPTTPPPYGRAGTDGAQWIIEGLAQRRYHVVDRWSPSRDGPDARLRQLAEWLLTKSGLAPADLIHEY